MRKLLTLTIALLAAFVAEAHSLSNEWHSSCEVENRYEEQLKCCHRRNIDAERTTSVVVPTARTTTSNISRQEHQRLLHISFIGRFATNTNYPVTRYIHRLGTCARAVDLYLYILCQLRL